MDAVAGTSDRVEKRGKYLDTVLEERDLISIEHVLAGRSRESAHESPRILRDRRHGYDGILAIRLGVHGDRRVEGGRRADDEQYGDDRENHSQVSDSSSSCAAAGSSKVNTLPPPGLSA